MRRGYQSDLVDRRRLFYIRYRLDDEADASGMKADPAPDLTDTVSRGARMRRALSWLAALALLVWIVERASVREVRAALAEGPWLVLCAFVLFENLVILVADSAATRGTLAVVGVRRPLRDVMLARAGAYVLGLVSYVASLGGLGWWMSRGGVRVSRATGAVLLIMVSSGMATVLVASGALLAGFPSRRPDGLLMLVASALAGIGLYLVVLGARPPWLTRRAFLSPLFETGVRGHLRAVVMRVPHMILLAVLNWTAFRIWGLEVPFLRGIVRVEAVLLVAALPMTPSGLGTTQVLQVLFFSEWARGATPDERSADVLAFSLSHGALGLLCQAALGTTALALSPRPDRVRRAAPQRSAPGER